MKPRLKTIFGAAIAAAAIAITPAGAKGISSPSLESGADTYGGCSIGGSYGYRGGYSRGSHYNSGRYNSGRYRSGHYNSGYRSSYGHASYSTRCRIVDRHYYRSGCYNYCRITYLHERVDCHGRIVSCWRSCKTVRC